jgi:hypothetical protein
MPTLIPAPFAARIVWLGRVGNRDAALESVAVEELRAGFAGPEGEAHGGLVRPACSRVANLYAPDTEIRNVRQFSVLSAEDLAAIAERMEVDRLDPALLGATMVVEGIPDFSRVPPSSRLQAEGGATLVVDMENRPCVLPAKPIEAALPGKGRAFKPAAAGRRGVTAWVEREGVLRVGATLRLFVPDQPVWAHLAAVRRG